MQYMSFRKQKAESVYKTALDFVTITLWLVCIGINTICHHPEEPNCAFLAAKSKKIRESQEFVE